MCKLARCLCHANASTVEPNAEGHLTYLMVGDHDHALREVELDAAIGSLPDLIGDGGVTADADGGRAPPLGHGGDEQAEGLLCQGHVGIVQVLVDPVQGSTKELGDGDAISMSGQDNHRICAYVSDL